MNRNLLENDAMSKIGKIEAKLHKLLLLDEVHSKPLDLGVLKFTKSKYLIHFAKQEIEIQENYKKLAEIKKARKEMADYNFKIRQDLNKIQLVNFKLQRLNPCLTDLQQQYQAIFESGSEEFKQKLRCKLDEIITKNL